jgi:hypothetical protein
MQRALLLALLGLARGGGLVTVGAAVVAAGSAGRDPHAWAGRAVLVQGVAVSPGCIVRESVLCAIGSPYAAYIVDPADGAFLPLTRAAATPLLSFLRRLPLARGLVPAAPALHWGTRVTYRVRLRAAPAGSCASVPCYEAVLPDAAPGWL